VTRQEGAANRPNDDDDRVADQDAVENRQAAEAAPERWGLRRADGHRAGIIGEREKLREWPFSPFRWIFVMGEQDG
jgi:hypothetical protein